ncbi:hypothetical protein EDC01DRAFT_755749 [Geopyxis carbonaria]|nr:hypothetical protein EDC01DRAFT_755749 [Geopyxis carbonaria]
MATETQPTPWPIDPNHGMLKKPGYLGDSHHSLRTRELFKYYQPSGADSINIVPPLNNGEPFETNSLNLSPSLRSSHDPILACFANLTTRMLDARRCIVTMTGMGLSYVVAESTRSLSIGFPHTHEPGDQLMLGGGSATASMDGLCEHTISLVPPPADSDEPFLLEIPDLSRHPKYHNVGYVRGWPHGRFYAGAPLRTRNGVSIGTVCVLDDKPRYGGLTPEQRVQMSNMADIFMNYLQTKQGQRDMERTKVMEMELSRFIAEGFLPSDSPVMTERRDGKLWSEKILEKRRAAEMERKKKVEEKRQIFQERQFAAMARREREKHEREKERRIREADAHFPFPPQSSQTIISTVETYETMMSPPPSSVDLWDRPSPIPSGRRPSVPCIQEPRSTESQEWGSNIKTVSTNTPTSNPSNSSYSLSNDGTLGSETDATSVVNTSRLSLSDNLGKRRLSNYEETTSIEPHFRSMFSRAATLIRNAIGAEVVFLDGDLEGFFSPGNGEFDDDASDDDSPLNASHVSTDYGTEAATRAHRPKSQRRRSGILGYSTSGGSSNSHCIPDTQRDMVRELGFDVSELNEETLKQLVDGNEEGQIVAQVDQYPGPQETEGPDPEFQATQRILQKFLLGSKSVIIMPLFDHNRKLFAVCFAWTCVSTRSFCGDIEGGFISGVANSIIAEVTRLNILNADKAKGEFISSISHELRSPLHGILASAEFLAESNLDADQRSFVDTAISCGTTLLDTVNHVLDFQKLNFLQDRKIEEASGSRHSDIASSLVNASLIDTDLSSLVQDVTEGVCLGYQFKGFSTPAGTGSTCRANSPENKDLSAVIVDIDRRAHGWVFNANPAAFRRIINNLVGNALKYNKESGWIRVCLKAEDLELDSDGNKKSIVRLSVADSGKGISREFLKTKLFTPFSQENPLSPGAGLGMSIVRQIVGMMEGKIDVKSQIGKGTTVTVEVQLVQKASGEPQLCDSMVALNTRTRGKKIRLVGFESYDDKNCTTPRQHASNFLYNSVVRYAKEYFGMDIVNDAAGDTMGDADIIVVNEMSEENRHRIRELSSAHPRLQRAPVIALCNRPPVDGTAASQLLADPNHVTTFLRKPCASKKLSRAIKYSLDVLDHATQATASPPIASPTLSHHAPRPALHRKSTSTADVVALTTPVSPLGNPIDNLFSLTTSDLLSPSKPSYSSSSPAVAASMNNQHFQFPTFELHLPKPVSSPSAVRAGKPTVLAVEDNHINMLLLTKYLKKKGYPFDKAVDGLEALNAVTARKAEGGYDVILMDLQMPVLSGVESTAEIRKLEAAHPDIYHRAYIVALTGLAAEGDRRDAFAAGVDEFMVKPVNFGQLEKLLREKLKNRNSPQ